MVRGCFVAINDITDLSNDSGCFSRTRSRNYYIVVFICYNCSSLLRIQFSIFNVIKKAAIFFELLLDELFVIIVPARVAV